jgi:hypothetical protein
LNPKPLRCWLNSWLATFLLGIVAANRLAIGQSPESIDDQVRLHQLQWIGTHNSYHIAPHPRLEKWIALAGKSILEGIQYTHRPLQEQLSKLQVRQLELDVYADPEGGLFSKPIGAAMAGDSSDAGELNPNPDGALDQPGFKILHAPGFDYLTRVATLSDALQQIREWSDRSPGHLPVLVMIELKESSPASAGVSLVKFDRQILQQLDALIHASFPRQQLLLPVDLKPEGVETIRDAVLQQGWPTLAQARGKLIFALDNEGPWVDRYLDAQEGDRQKATLFVSVEPTHPMAAWMKRNDPVGQFEEIQSLVRRNSIWRYLPARFRLGQRRAVDQHRFSRTRSALARLLGRLARPPGRSLESSPSSRSSNTRPVGTEDRMVWGKQRVTGEPGTLKPSHGLASDQRIVSEGRSVIRADRAGWSQVLAGRTADASGWITGHWK